MHSGIGANVALWFCAFPIFLLQSIASAPYRLLWFYTVLPVVVSAMETGVPVLITRVCFGCVRSAACANNSCGFVYVACKFLQRLVTGVNDQQVKATWQM